MLATFSSLNRRKYQDVWHEISDLPISEILEIDGDGSRQDANKIRTALQGMARYRNEFKLVTSVVMTNENSWRIIVIKKALANEA